MRAGFLALALAAWAPACSGATRPPPVSGPPPGASAPDNPFVGARFYVDPDYVAKVELTIPIAPSRAAQIRRAEAYPTGIWLDSIANTALVSRDLDAALAQQKSAGQPVVTLFVIYDLPERDCSAKASSGELTLTNGGESRYQTEYLDRIAAQLRAHPAQRIVLIVEPDSLANIATNLGVAKCAGAEATYRHSIARAIRTLSMPHVSLYLDAAHAGWLGWQGNRLKIAKIFRDVLTEAGGVDTIRGFATNVSNYDSLRGGDIARLEPSDPCADELTYVEKLSATLADVGITGKGFIVDTARNGRSGIKTKSGSWCNVKGAGLGERPQASPGPRVDAYWWVKPPGDSDGASDPTAAGYDETCGAGWPDAAPGAPSAGRWFPSYFLQLIDNATPPL